LPVHQGDFGLRQIILSDDPRFGHFVVEIVAFACAFADACEHRNTAMEFGNIIDEFHDHHCLADSCAAKGSDLTPFEKRAD
jgi:hypothetical protein